MPLAKAFLRARLPGNGVLVTGPLMPDDVREDLHRLAADRPKIRIVEFVTDPCPLLAQATRVIAMGGYNTFCEILSLDKRALLVPRSTPRKEQLIRATKAGELGLVNMLDGDGSRPWQTMAAALRQLPSQPLPSEAKIDGILDGLSVLSQRVRRLLESSEPAVSMVLRRAN